MALTLRAQSMRHAVRDALERVHEVFVSDSFVPASSNSHVPHIHVGLCE